MVRHHRPSADFSANSACRIASNIRDPHASVDMGPTAPLLSLLLSSSCSSEATIRPNCGRRGGTHFSSSCTAGEPLLCRASRMNCSLLLCPLFSCPLLLWPASASAIRQSAAPNSPGADTTPTALGAFGAEFAELFAEVFAELAEDGSGLAPRGWKGRPERTTKRPRTACVPYRSYSALRSGAPPRSSSLPQRANCDDERSWRYAHRQQGCWPVPTARACLRGPRRVCPCRAARRHRAPRRARGTRGQWRSPSRARRTCAGRSHRQIRARGSREARAGGRMLQAGGAVRARKRAAAGTWQERTHLSTMRETGSG